MQEIHGGRSWASFSTSVTTAVKKGTRPRNVAKSKEKGQGQKGFHGIDEEAVDETSVETAQGLGDLDLCAVEHVWEAGAAQTCAGIADDSPPGLVDFFAFVLWAKYLGPESGPNHWDAGH